MAFNCQTNNYQFCSNSVWFLHNIILGSSYWLRNTVCSYQKKGAERSLLIDMLLLILQQHLWFVWKHFHMFCFSCGYNQLFIPDDFFMAVYWCVSYHQLCSNSLMFLNNYFHKYCFCCCHTNLCLPEIGVDDCLLPKMLQSALQ